MDFIFYAIIALLFLGVPYAIHRKLVAGLEADLATAQRQAKSFSSSAAYHKGRIRDFEDALARVNRNEKRKLDGLPKSYFAGIDKYRSVKRKTALTHTAIEHPTTGIMIDASVGAVTVSRDGEVLANFTVAGEHFNPAPGRLAVASVGG